MLYSLNTPRRFQKKFSWRYRTEKETFSGSWNRKRAFCTSSTFIFSARIRHMIAPLKSAAVHFQLILSPLAVMTRSMRYGRALRHTIVSCLHTQNFTTWYARVWAATIFSPREGARIPASSIFTIWERALIRLTRLPLDLFALFIVALPLSYRWSTAAYSMRQVRWNITPCKLRSLVALSWGPFVVLWTNGLTGLYSRQRCMRWHVEF